MKLDVEFDRNDKARLLLQEHCDLVVDDKRLPRLVVPRHELRVLITDKHWHELFDPINLDVVLTPTEKLSKAVVHLDDLTEFRSIRIDNDEV